MENLAYKTRKILSVAWVLGTIFYWSGIASGQEVPEAVSICEVKNNPGAYNHKLLQLTGFVSHGFEDFTLSDPICSSWPAIWLEYGGTAMSGTMYCCGVSADRHRRKQLVIESIPIPLLEDEQFKTFDKLINPPPKERGSVVHAILIGRFFSGKETLFPKGGITWGGYGHMGCCTFFAIQEVKSVDPQDRDDLDYAESVDQPPMGKVGCGFQFLTAIDTTPGMLKVQQNADQEQQDWIFNDPQLVAIRALAQYAKVDEAAITGLQQTQTARGRAVYQWKPNSTNDSYMIVVSRPYWLSFYARDSKRVAWVIAGAYRSSCDKN